MKRRDPTILDVVDGFFDGEPDVAAMSGQRLMEFGTEVKRFAASWDPVVSAHDHFPVYVGGLPSANFWLASHGQLVLTTLLYSDLAIVRDPLSDWFADERYLEPSLMRSRPGYRDQTVARAVAQTRQFLRVALAGLEAMRPLIEAGIVVPVPARRILASHRAAVGDITARIVASAASDPIELSTRFRPRDLALDDNVRGAFIFAGGNRAEQIAKAFTDASEFFARELVLARSVGANFLAPFPFESFLVEAALDAEVFADPAAHAAHALLSSRLSVFAGLTPDVVASVHDDDAFGAFRSELHVTYSNVPLGETPARVEQYVRNAEEGVLRPRLDEAERQVRKGRLKQFLHLSQDAIHVATTVAASSAAPLIGAPATAGTVAAGGEVTPV